MTATRLQNGWRLNLTDSEMMILKEAVAHLQADFDGDEQMGHLEPAEKAAFRRSFSTLRWPETVDDRRRA